MIGLLLRLAVMPFTMHGDMLHVYHYPHVLIHGNWHVYELAAEATVNYYPPLALLFFAGIQLLLRFLIPPFEVFTHVLLDGNPGLLFDSDHLFLSLFLMKVPYLAVEWLLIRTCWRMLPDEKEKRLFTIFWVVNPVVIYGTYMVGQFDLIPTFCVVLACYFCLREGKEHYACLAAATGCLFKIFPIIFLPVIVLIAGRSLKDYVRLLLYGIAPVIVLYYAFYLVSGDVVFKILSDLSYQTKISVDYKVLALRFFQAGVYGLVCIHIVFFTRDRLDYPVVAQYFLAIYLAVYWGMALGQTHYFLWFIPFFVLLLPQRPEWRKPFYVIVAIIFLAGLRARSACLGIFAPLNPEFFMSLPSLKDVTGFLFDQKVYDFTIKLLFKGLTAVMVVSILRNLYFPAGNRAT